MSWFSDLLDAIGKLFGGGDETPLPPAPTGARVGIRVRQEGGGNVSIGGALVTIAIRGKNSTRGTDANGWVRWDNVDPGPRHLYVEKNGYRDHNEHFEVKAPDTSVTVAIRKKTSAPSPSPGPGPSPGPVPPMTSDKVTALQRVAAAYITEYEQAHVGRQPNTVQPKQEAFIRRSAACLHYGAPTLGIAGDGQTMLLGQRGGNVIAQDAVIYKGNYYDVIVGAGTQGRDLNRLVWPVGKPQGNAKAITPDKGLVPKAGSGRRRRSGLVRTVEEWLADDGGQFYVLNATLFPAIHLVLHDKPLYVDTCQWLFELGVDAQRILCTTGSPKGSSWTGRDWDSRSPKFPGWLELAIDVAWNNGLRTQPTIFGSDGYHPTDADKHRFVDVCNRVFNGDREKILFEEEANEYWHESILNADTTLLRELGKRANASTDIPVALSTPRFVSDGFYRDSGVQVGTVHTWRAGATGIRRNEVKTIPGFPLRRMDNEPRGIRASAGGDVRDPATLANDLKESAANGINGYCFHMDWLVWFGLHQSKTPIWDDPNAEKCLKAIAKARDQVTP